MSVDIVVAQSDAQVEIVRTLFAEYWNAFGFSPCFQNFDAELARLPGDYAVPRGRLGLATVDAEPAGCIALRPLSEDSCEMKRLYVREQFRSARLGKALVEWVVAQARALGYARLYADTLPVMRRALAMYEAMGFERCAPYNGKGSDEAIYLSLELPARV